MAKLVVLVQWVVVDYTDPSGLSGQIHDILRLESGCDSIKIDKTSEVGVFVTSFFLLPVSPEFVGKGVVQEEFWGIG